MPISSRMSREEQNAYRRYIDGRAEGRAEEKLENARNLKKNGIPADIIAKSLGLTTEEVEALS